MREVAPGARSSPYWLALAGAAFLIASLIAGWLNFLDGQKHPAPAVAAVAVWAAAAIIGFAACALVYARAKDGALRASAVAGAWLGRGVSAIFAVVDRFLVAPTTGIARLLGDWIPEGDGALGRFATASGQLALASARAPALPLLIVLAVVLAVAVALFAPGVSR